MTDTFNPVLDDNNALAHIANQLICRETPMIRWSDVAQVAWLVTVALCANAQTNYPTKPVRIVVPYFPGTPSDLSARMLGQKFSEAWNKPVVIENVAGASGNIGTELVARATADGHTLLQVVTPHAINAALYSNLSFDFMRDIVPVICSARLAYVVVVNPSVPVT